MSNKTGIEHKFTNRTLRTMGYYAIIVCIFSAYTFRMYKQDKADQATYIIKNKYAQKISYAPVDNQSDLHVMEFGKFNTDSLLYKHLNVGDTISGYKSVMNKAIVPASQKHKGPFALNVYNFSVTRDYNIHSVNGEMLVQIKRKEQLAKEQARRDSIMRVKKQRHK